jgi:hypothetical protein
MANGSVGQALFQGTLFNAVTLGVAIVAVLVTGITAFYQRRSLLPPRRRLTIVAQPPVPLLSKGSVEGITVTYDDVRLNDPHVTTISLVNTGRHDIGSGQFDQGRPIELRLGVRIAKVIDASATPQGAPVPKHQVDGSAIRIGPDLIARAHVLTLQVLTAGRPELQSTAYLTDTKLEIRRELPLARALRAIERVPPSAVTAISAIVAVAVVLGLNNTLIQGRVLEASVPEPPRAEVPVPDVTVMPSPALPGATIEITGDDFVVGENVDVVVDCPIASPPRTGISTSGTTRVDEHGDFTLQLALPSHLAATQLVVRSQLAPTTR